MDKDKLVVGGRYHWQGQPERLIYLGLDVSGRRYQFSRVEYPEIVWIEVSPNYLHLIVETEES